MPLRSMLFRAVVAAAVVVTAQAHEPAPVAASPRSPAPDATAAPAVAVVEQFGAALLAGDRARIEALLDPEVLILESGSAEHGRAAYLAQHAGEDIDFLRGARIELAHRATTVDGALAVVASESTVHAHGKDGPIDLASTETMVLRRGPDGWRIVQVHWSSHRLDGH